MSVNSVNMAALADLNLTWLQMFSVFFIYKGNNKYMTVLDASRILHSYFPLTRTR